MDSKEPSIFRAALRLACPPSFRSCASTSHMSLSPPAHILRVDDDILECIIGDVVASDGVRPHAAVHLSHVCRRLRRIILARASFWTNLEICDETHPNWFILSLSAPTHCHSKLRCPTSSLAAKSSKMTLAQSARSFWMCYTAPHLGSPCHRRSRWRTSTVSHWLAFRNA